MSTIARGVLVGSGTIALITGAVLFIQFWNLYTTEAVQHIESGGHVATPADFAWAVTGLALAAVGVVLILVGFLRRRGVRLDHPRA